MTETTFSIRQGLAVSPEIEYRESLPANIREPIFRILISYVPAAFLRERIQAILNPYGIAAMPDGEVEGAYREHNEATVSARQAFSHCSWFQVYDIIEDIFRQLAFHERELAHPEEKPRAFPLQNEINTYFQYAGIGWQLVDGQIVIRGEDTFEQTVQTSEGELTIAGRTAAAGRIKKAVQNLSARPTPDTAGAISHATGAMECVLHDITGEQVTLGDYLSRHKDMFPGSIRKALEGLWGFSSQEGARHGREGAEPARDDAEFVVAIAAAVTTYLNRRHPRS